MTTDRRSTHTVCLQACNYVSILLLNSLLMGNRSAVKSRLVGKPEKSPVRFPAEFHFDDYRVIGT